MKKSLALLAAIAGASMLLSGSAHAARAVAPAFKANLTASANIPPGPPGATGNAKLSINADAGRICQTISYQRTRGPLTGAHIHVGKKGVVGPIVVDLKVLPSGESACFSADRNVLRAIVKNPAGYYVNLHTANFPDGVLRGQLRKG